MSNSFTCQPRSLALHDSRDFVSHPRNFAPPNTRRVSHSTTAHYRIISSPSASELFSGEHTNAVQNAMTSASASNSNEKLTIYPDYCHDLSPTLGRWCPLRASDLGMLRDVGVYVDGISPSLFHLILQQYISLKIYCGIGD